MDFRTEEEKQMDALESRISDLEKCVELLMLDCSCTIKERMSGHLVDCPVPHVKEILYGDGA